MKQWLVVAPSNSKTLFYCYLQTPHHILPTRNGSVSTIRSRFGLLHMSHVSWAFCAKMAIFHMLVKHHTHKAKLTLQISQHSDHSTELFYIQNNHKEHIFKVTYRKLCRNPDIKICTRIYAWKSWHHYFVTPCSIEDIIKFNSNVLKWLSWCKKCPNHFLNWFIWTFTDICGYVD